MKNIKVKDMSKKVIYGIFDDEEVLLNSVKEVRSNDISIKEVFSPFPIHGLDHALGLERTRLAIAAFIYGAIEQLDIDLMKSAAVLFEGEHFFDKYWS